MKAGVCALAVIAALDLQGTVTSGSEAAPLDVPLTNPLPPTHRPAQMTAPNLPRATTWSTARSGHTTTNAGSAWRPTGPQEAPRLTRARSHATTPQNSEIQSPARRPQQTQVTHAPAHTRPNQQGYDSQGNQGSEGSQGSNSQT